MTTFSYRIAGLTIASELELPNCSSSTAAPDIHIRYGTTPSQLEQAGRIGALYQVNATEYLLDVPTVGRFYVTNGRDITLDLYPNADLDVVRLVVMDAPLAVACLQRGDVVLHASAVGTPKGAMLLAGLSAAGKSTAAAGLYQRGYRVLTDDWCLLRWEHNQIMVYPTYAQVLLWPPALQRLQIAVTSLSRARKNLRKFVLPIPQQFATTPLPVAAIYPLAAHRDPKEPNSIQLKPITGFAKVDYLTDYVLHGSVIRGMGNQNQHIQRLTQLALTAPIIQVLRPAYPFLLQRLLDQLEKSFSA